MTKLPRFHVGDTGTWTLTVTDEGSAQDISTATGISALVEQPDGTFTTWTAVKQTDGSDGKVDVTLGTLTQGSWAIQLKLTFTSKVRHSDPLRFEVGRALE